MAISLARGRRIGQQRTTSKRLAKEYGAQQKKAQKRKGISGLLGKGLGMGLGSLAAGALGIASGGLLMPLVMAAGSFGGKKIAHEMTRGMGAKTGKLKGDMYGYGDEEAMSLKKDLKSQMAVDPMKERGGFGKDLLSSYVSAGMAGNLGGVKGALTKGGTSDQLLGIGEFGTGMKGAEGAKAGLGDLFGTKWGGEDAGAAADIPGSNAVESSLEDQSLAMDQESEVMLDDGYSYAQGGQVPEQQLMTLLALMSQQQEQTAYSGTPLQEEKQPSIAEHFASQGKTLGGNDTQSLSQKLGR